MTPLMEVTTLRKAFAGVVALDGLDTRIEEGEILGLVGANGAGKTTALNVIGGQLTPDSGVVRLAGERIESLPPWRRARLGVGRTFQDSRMWLDLTAEEHLRIAIEASHGHQSRESRPDAIEGMRSSVELPKQMLTCLPSQMRLLDRRRVELAMAALNASNILLIDEIGAGLDIQEASILYRLIAALIGRRRVRAAVLVEHKLELLAAFATVIELIEDGKVVQRARCDDPVQVAHLMDRMFDRHSNGSLKAKQTELVP